MLGGRRGASTTVTAPVTPVARFHEAERSHPRCQSNCPARGLLSVQTKGDRPPTDCAQHVVNECILASSLIQDRLCDAAVGMHHDRSPRPQRGPPSHRRGYSTDFFIVNMHSGHFGPIRAEDTVVPVSSPETAAGRAASVS